MSRFTRQYGILNISYPYRPPRPVTGIALLFFLLPLFIAVFSLWNSLKDDTILTRDGLMPLRAEFNHAGSSFHIPATGWQLHCYSSSASERKGIDKNWKLFRDATAEREVQREWSGAWREPPTSHAAQLQVLGNEARSNISANWRLQRCNCDSYHWHSFQSFCLLLKTFTK
jgi:hypothetical protein